ncbi:hypothetical protein PROFUN_08795 [Planoprotostelium fungivorum]|uniref:Uncharacterized protein n=1 Tax=Planoprotostelium fungivorum TaxID=1890364 RepID=A0A2P6MVQ9_9EUKA|nr:hypothetical protein PROFUN_08795 [Planoprotostelium fungivorum]
MSHLLSMYLLVLESTNRLLKNDGSQSSRWRPIMLLKIRRPSAYFYRCAVSLFTSSHRNTGRKDPLVASGV